MKSACAAALLLSLGVGAAFAEEGTRNFYTGQQFLQEHRSSDNVTVRGYAMGVLDVGTLQRHVCPGNITAGQVAEVGAKYIEAHPEIWDWPAAALLTNAFIQAWPCPKAPAKK